MSTNKLYVGNLSYTTDEEKLREVFSAYGNVISINIIKGRGFGFVEMESEQAAQSAKEALDGTEVDGLHIKVDEARPRPKRSGGGGRGRDRDFRGKRFRY